uniref:ESPR domain-containing protein n=1 Tax=uncultured Massilia sp. TaxID=169973 RepID=UPI0025CFBBB1
MNHIYRLVWNKKRNMLVAVAETASAHGKDASGETTAGAAGAGGGAVVLGARTLMAAALCALFPLAAVAQEIVHQIPASTQESLYDGDGSNAAAANWKLRNDGVLDIGGTDAGTQLLTLSGSGTVLLGDRLLTLTSARGDNEGFYLGTLQGSGGLAIDGGYEILGGANTYLGSTTVASGATLALSGSGSIALSSGLSNDGVFDVAAVNDGARVRSLAGSGTVLLGGQDLRLTQAAGTYAGTIDGAGGLHVAAGTEVLSGANTYYGATTIAQDGALVLSGSGSIAYSSGVANNGTFDIAGTDSGAEVRSLSGSGTVLLGGQALTLSGAYQEFTGVVDGAGVLAVNGGNQALGGSNTYTGATVIGEYGTLSLSGSGSIALSAGVDNQGVLDTTAATAATHLQSLSGSGTVVLGNQDLVLTQAGSAFDGTFAGKIEGDGGLHVAGGTEVLSGENTYYGATTIAQDGALVLSGSGSIAHSSGVATNGVFDIAGTDSGAEVRSLSGSGTVLLGGQTLTLSNAQDVFAGAIHGSGGLAVS